MFSRKGETKKVTMRYEIEFPDGYVRYYIETRKLLGDTNIGVTVFLEYVLVLVIHAFADNHLAR